MKKILNTILLAACLLPSIVSCKIESTTCSGDPGEVLVVIEKKDWEGTIGKTLRDTLESDCQFLPQREPLYTVKNVTPSLFNELYKVHRNIIRVRVNGSLVPGITIKHNVWSKPQVVIDIDALDYTAAEKLVAENKGTIVSILEKEERERVIRNVKEFEEPSIAAAVKAMIGGSPHFPKGYGLKKITDDFIWIASETQFVQQGIFVYTYPHRREKDGMTSESIIRHRNEILKDNVPGMFEGTYMTTNMAAYSAPKYIKDDVRHFTEVRGLWEVEQDFMGGPFISQSFYSPDGVNMIVLEGWIYAPKFDKREYLRQVEGILDSFEWEKSSENL